MSIRMGVSIASVLAIGLSFLLGWIVVASPEWREVDPLPVGSVWRGRLTQQGTHPEANFPPEIQAVLTITERDGNRVSAELHETVADMDVTFLCRGRLRHDSMNRLVFEFYSEGVKGEAQAEVFIVRVPYTARVEGDTMRGKWRFVDETHGVDVRGDFVLKRD